MAKKLIEKVDKRAEVIGIKKKNRGVLTAVIDVYFIQSAVNPNEGNFTFEYNQPANADSKVIGQAIKEFGQAMIDGKVE